MMVVAVVGVCASGKSTLVRNLCSAGVKAYSAAQEHSCVPMLWQHKSPDLLIFLEASLETVRKRRSAEWSGVIFQWQTARLSNAKAHADLIINTDFLSEDEVMKQVMTIIRRKSNGKADT